jgi:hypothetical protein
MKPFTTLAAPAVLLLVAACATPDAALEQANHTSALMAGMEKELGNFRRVHAVAEQSMQESLRAQRQVLANAKLKSAPLIRARQSAGDTATQALADRMIADAAALGDDEAAAAESMAANDAAVAALLVPLPATGTAITQAQARMAALGVELSRSTRAGELRAFAQEVRKNVDDNRKKIDEAKAAAARTP